MYPEMISYDRLLALSFGPKPNMAFTATVSPSLWHLCLLDSGRLMTLSCKLWDLFCQAIFLVAVCTYLWARCSVGACSMKRLLLAPRWRKVSTSFQASAEQLQR